MQRVVNRLRIKFLTVCLKVASQLFDLLRRIAVLFPDQDAGIGVQTEKVERLRDRLPVIRADLEADTVLFQPTLVIGAVIPLEHRIQIG